MVTHRYLGVLVGLLMLLWFASGVVMLFVHWPEVTADERAAALAPIPWSRCCKTGDVLPGVELVASATVEELAGRVVLRLPNRVADLTTGQPLQPLTEAEARAVAGAYARAIGVQGEPASAKPVVRDQWTVTGYFNQRRPFWRVGFDDPAATEIYVSGRAGEVSQATTRSVRVLNWLGPIPHWLYPAILRQDVKLWTQVVVWSSLLGLFLTVTGLYLGIIAWRPWRDSRLSPYRGLMLWHHLTGLAAGLLTLTWTLSGLLSMQPWGLLESSPDPRLERYGESTVTGGDLSAALGALKGQLLSVRQVRLAPLDGQLFLVADARRVDAAARPTPLSPADLARAASRLGPIGSQDLMTREDAYYYGHHATVRLPVWRVILADGTRYYLDLSTGEVLGSADATAKAFRWLHLGLHRLDFIRGLDRGAAWAAGMTVLLLLAGVGVAAGAWLGVKRITRDLSRSFSALRRRA